jgi:hypothetical protein
MLSPNFSVISHFFSQMDAGRRSACLLCRQRHVLALQGEGPDFPEARYLSALTPFASDAYEEARSTSENL